jgi:serine/threonine protein kinase
VDAEIGRGSYSKVKKVRRDALLMSAKVMHKPSLESYRAIRYDCEGEMEMITNLDKVHTEIQIQTKIDHPHIVKVLEIINDEEHDELCLIMELADLG